MRPAHPRPRILKGHVLDILRGFTDESVHCVVTSPPYWGLRDYGIPPVFWGGDPTCTHEWSVEPPRRRRSPDDVQNPDSLQAAHTAAAVELAADPELLPVRRLARATRARARPPPLRGPHRLGL